MTKHFRHCLKFCCLAAVMLIVTVGWAQEYPDQPLEDKEPTGHDCGIFCNRQRDKCIDSGRESEAV